MSQFGGKDSKRHFTVVIGNKEHGFYVSSTPSSAAKKVVTKLCSANKSKKVEFHIREITQGSKKKIYGPYIGHIEKLKEPIELKGRVIKYKPFVKLIKKKNLDKRKMKGGGYGSTLKVNKYINHVINDNRYNFDKDLLFTVTNVDTQEKKEYKNIHYLGQGRYGKVFLVQNADEKYVIKLLLNSDYINSFLKEAKLLNSFMNEINNKCKYKSISQGKNIIDRMEIGHIIFPFKGDKDLKKIIGEPSNYNIIPKILSDIISCLIDINKFACHLDLKLDNIVYDSGIKSAFIIDYGLSMLFPIDIEKVVIGNRQISVDIIIYQLLYLLNIKNYISTFSILYPYEYLSVIQSTIDNFGLFWIIIESITSENIKIFDSYLNNEGEFLYRSLNKNLLIKYLNYYFSLDDTSPKELISILSLSNIPDLRKNFIDDVRSKISSVKFDFYFKTEENYNQFMEKVLGLVRFDPRTRIPKEELLQDLFFAIRDSA